MAKDLVALYQEVLRRSQNVLGLSDLATTRSRLYALLLAKPLDPRLAEVLSDLQLSASYVRTHLLSIGSWPSDVQHAIRSGLPYQDARRVAKLDEGSRSVLLQQYMASGGEERSVDRVRAREREIEHDRLAKELATDEHGWTLPSDSPSRRVYTFEAVSTFRAADVVDQMKALPRRALQGLLCRYTAPGDAVVDPIAGSGGTAVAAHTVGRWAWSADALPRYRFIHHVDATDAEALRTAVHAGGRAVDLVVLHLPTIDAWLADPRRAAADVEAYEAWMRDVITIGASLPVDGGHVGVIVRPYRAVDDARLLTDHIVQHFLRAWTTVVGYHLLVDAVSNADWHVVVGRRSAS